MLEKFKKIRSEMNHAFEFLIETKVESPAIREMMRYAIDGGKRLSYIIFMYDTR